MEYLKNLVLQLYTTGEAEALLPVFAALLAFGPSDMQRCKQVRCCYWCCCCCCCLCLCVCGVNDLLLSLPALHACQLDDCCTAGIGVLAALCVAAGDGLHMNVLLLCCKHASQLRAASTQLNCQQGSACA
jgi:hypothetical protein